MKREQAMSLIMALNTEGLKVKYLSSDSYVSLLSLKRPLQKYINEMAEEEYELCKGYEIPYSEMTKRSNSDKSFREKVDAVQSKEFTPKELNFIPIDQFKKFTDEIDFGPASILAEYLLKDEILP